LTKIDDFYFSNVQQVNIYLDDYSQARQLYSDVIKIFINFKNLKTLLIYTNWSDYNRRFSKEEVNEFMKNYQMKQFENYCLFNKKET
jgi:DNA-directed RNA polymerase alpha subunit